ncbi:hypothetical protein E5288_WYG012084 [Bos mutus]|uniref:Uncharacterized protein n=1 Tax=Bos mutus TaxID=72004 RepID=A0A6B0R5C0_9CETA|nr:hypothetical protein [Bos mutus]
MSSWRETPMGKNFKNRKFEERPEQSGGPSLQGVSHVAVGLDAGPSAGAPCSEDRSSSEPETALHAGWGEAVPLGRGDAPREDQHLQPPGCLEDDVAVLTLLGQSRQLID